MSCAGLLVVQPDVLLSGTRVAGSFRCARQAVLEERLGGDSGAKAVEGTLLHELFQVSTTPDPHFSACHNPLLWFFLSEFCRQTWHLHKNLQGTMPYILCLVKGLLLCAVYGAWLLKDAISSFQGTGHLCLLPLHCPWPLHHQAFQGSNL